MQTCFDTLKSLKGRECVRKAVVILSVALLVLDASCVTFGSDTAVSREGFVSVSGTGNRFAGFASLDDGFGFADANTTCSFDSVFPVSNEINLSGGQLDLNKDLFFSADAEVLTGGTFVGNSHAIIFPKEKETLQWPTGTKKLVIADTETQSEGVRSVSWSFDNSYLAVGIADNAGGDELNIFYFDGSVLTLTASAELTDDINSVRWHPTLHFLAVGANRGSNELVIYQLDVPSGSFTQTDNQNINQDAFAVAWQPSGAHLAVAENSGSEIEVFSFDSGAGTLTTVAVGGITGNVDASRDAISWESGGTYFAVGWVSNSPNLTIFEFTGAAANDIVSITVNSAATTVEAVAWSPAENVIAIGIDLSTERFRIYDFDPDAATLVEQTSARIGEGTGIVYGVDWSSDGKCFVLGRETNASGTELRVFRYNAISDTSIELDGEDFTPDVTSVRFSPNDELIGVGASFVSTDAQARAYTIDDGIQSFIFDTVTLTLNTDIDFLCTTSFVGPCVIDGNGHVVTVTSNGVIIVDGASSSLHFKNVIVKGINGTNVRCTDNLGTFSLQDMQWVQNGNYCFDTGHLAIEEHVVITGTGTFSYQTDQESFINDHSTLEIASGLTFRYAPSSADNTLLCFEDSTSILRFHNSCFNITSTGLQLTKGCLMIDGVVQLCSEASVQAEGVVFGDGTAANDFFINVYPGASLEVTDGYLIYNNVS